MFPYRVKYTESESESDIQNNDLLYKIDHTCQNTFEKKINRKSKIESFKLLFCYLHK